MPDLAPKPCARPGCRAYALPGRSCCAEHVRAAQADHDRRRGSSAARGYGSRWQRYRSGYLRRHPLCPCGAPATDVDHVQAVSGPADPLFWQGANHQALCHACHSRKTATIDGGLGHGLSARRVCQQVSRGNNCLGGGSDSSEPNSARPIGPLTKKLTGFHPPGGYRRHG